MTRADKFLVDAGYFETRARAQAAIAAGRVSVNGVALSKASQKIPPGAQIDAREAYPYVSRAALKLVEGLDVFGVDPTGCLALDVGSSTGGFTEVLLERGARHVIAVDVGRDQLHARLRDDTRVTSLESTDARHLTADLLGQAPEIIVCDASFISLTKVIQRPLELAADRADLIALIKPQFEVGKAGLGKGGLVKSQVEADRAIAEVRAALDGLFEFSVLGMCDSPIRGGDGNEEYLIHARKRL
ncbi:TlyA family RNA methyltransferase [Maricaulis sp. D1M11]|uniref:TlyA family RNA methyltransferase n=1 Tax=Maricaulis sp. D1M11 TaxID=3076117 RepID=UPI0039B5B106